MNGPIRHLARLLVVGLVLTGTAAALAVLGRGFDFKHQIELADKRYGPRGQQVLTQWRDMMQAEQGASRAEQLRKVNAFMNSHIRFQDDIVSWGVEDYWATPLEAMGRGVGDCEDYAIAKYFSLLILGVPSDQLRITYARARLGGPLSTVFEAHMVLAYYPSVNAEPVLLDNLIDEIQPASSRPDLTPVFGFNSDGLWIGASQGTGSSGNSTARLSHWRDLIERMHEDGFE